MNAVEFSFSLNSALPKDSGAGWLQFALTLYIVKLREKFGVNINCFHWK